MNKYSEFAKKVPTMLTEEFDLRDAAASETLTSLESMLIDIRALHSAWRVERILQAISDEDWPLAGVFFDTLREQVNALCEKAPEHVDIGLPSPITFGSAGRPVILVAANQAKVLNAVLAMLGGYYDVHGVASHERALEFLNRGRPDLFILDMPERRMLLSLIRKLPEHKLTPVLFLTDAKTSEACEGLDFIKKPVDILELKAAIDRRIFDRSPLTDASAHA